MKRLYFYLVAILLLSVFSTQAQNTNGTDFWVTFGLNPAEGKSNPDLRIRVVSNEKPVKGSIFFTCSGTSIAIDIPAQMVETYDLTPEEVLYVYNTVQGKSNFSIHITTDNSVMVYVMNQNNMSTDATNLLPVSALGTEYYHISYQPYSEPPYREFLDAYAVIAIADNTKFYHNGTHIETLNRGQVYYKTETFDMTGAHITSDKPIAFFALNQGPKIPFDCVGSPDCLVQQLAPVNTWGKTYFVPVTIKQNDIVRVVASQNNTNITQLVGGTIRTAPGAQLKLNDLQAGEFIELDILLSDNGCYIQADKPVGVCTYMTVPEYDGGNLGDPSQCWMSAIEQSVTQAFLTSFVPNPNNTAIKQHYVLITTPTDTKNDTRISIGGSEPTPLSGGVWRDHAAAGMSFYNMELTNHESAHFFSNDEGMVVLCYGLGQFESYYYIAFSAMRNLSAAFYVNDIHYQDLSEHLFCINPVKFRADIDNMGTEVESIKWYIDDVEELSAQNKEAWEKDFLPGKYHVKMWIYSEDGETLILENTISIGAHISAAVSPEEGGSVEGEGCYQVDEEITLTATPNIGYLFANWTENSIPVSQEASFTFSTTESRNFVANFTAKSYLINVDVNHSEYGYATGAGEYGVNATATVSAFPNHCYRFANWTIDTVEVSTDNVYSFIVTEDVNLLANFYNLDFDTYAVMICDYIFLLNLKKLAEDGYEVSGCKWFKNGIEAMDTHTQSEFSYSEGDNKRLETEPNYYMFQLITNNHGELCSSEKRIVGSDKVSRCITPEGANKLIVYPNPALSGSTITVEGDIKGSQILVYNHLGACIHSIIAPDNLITLSLQLPQGIYLIRVNESHVKIIITN